MKVQYDPAFIKKLKKVNVRIRRAFEKQLAIFLKNPFEPQLNNHELNKPYQGLRSIDITADWRAFYDEIHQDDGEIAYFSTLGTHDELYKKTFTKNLYKKPLTD